MAFIGLSVVGVSLINWQDYKDPILKKIQNLTDCQIDIKGPIHLKFFPTPHLVLNDVFVKPLSKNLGTDSLKLESLYTKSLGLTWRWLPLLKGKLDIYHFKVDEPLISLKSVHANKSLSNSTHAVGSILCLRRFLVQKGEVTIDSGTSQGHKIQKINLEGSIESLLGPIELKGSLTYDDISFSNIIFSLKENPQSSSIAGAFTVTYGTSAKGTFDFEGSFKKDEGILLTVQSKNLFIEALPQSLIFKGLFDYSKNALKTQMAFSQADETVSIEGNTNLEKENSIFEVNCKKLTHGGYQINNIYSRITVKGDDVSVEKIEADAYKGKIQAKGHLQLNKKFNIKGHIQDVDLTTIPTIKESSVQSGLLNSDMSLTGNVKDLNQLLKTLNGMVSVKVVKGGVQTLDIESLTQQVKKIRDWKSLSEGLKLTQKRNILNIDLLKGDFDINQGIANTKNLTILSDLVDVEGKGRIDLEKIYLDLTLKVKIKSLGNLKIPFKIQGDWDNLDYGIDGEEFGVLITQDLGQHVMDKVLNQAKKQAVEVFRKLG